MKRIYLVLVVIANFGCINSLRVGEFLQGSFDAISGTTIYSVTPEYGVLAWDNPVTGTYGITVQITDNDGATLNVPITLTVGTTGWVFIDPKNGSDTNAGSLTAPLKTMLPLHNGTNAPSRFSGHRVVLMGNDPIPLIGMTTNRDNYRMDGNNVPVIFVAYPGHNPILEAQKGWFVIGSGANDFYFGGITYRYGPDFNPGGNVSLGAQTCIEGVDLAAKSTYMFLVLESQSRLTWFNNKNQDYKGRPCNVGMGNSAIIYMSSSSYHRNVAVVKNLIGGGQTNKTGTLVQSYSLQRSVIEQNEYKDAIFTTYDTSTHSAIYLKDSPLDVTVRANRFIYNLRWGSNTSNYSPVAIGGQRGAVRVEICYNKLDTRAHRNPGRIAGQSWANNPNSYLSTEIFWYRNSFAGKFVWLGGKNDGLTDKGEHFFDNLIESGGTTIGPVLAPSDSSDPTIIAAYNASRTFYDKKVEEYNNVFGTGLLDANMNIQDSMRSTLVGAVGADIAE